MVACFDPRSSTSRRIVSFWPSRPNSLSSERSCQSPAQLPICGFAEWYSTPVFLLTQRKPWKQNSLWCDSNRFPFFKFVGDSKRVSGGKVRTYTLVRCPESLTDAQPSEELFKLVRKKGRRLKVIPVITSMLCIQLWKLAGGNSVRAV